MGFWIGLVAFFIYSYCLNGKYYFCYLLQVPSDCTHKTHFWHAQGHHPLFPLGNEPLICKTPLLISQALLSSFRVWASGTEDYIIVASQMMFPAVFWKEMVRFFVPQEIPKSTNQPWALNKHHQSRGSLADLFAQIQIFHLSSNSWSSRLTKEEV